MLLPKTLNKFAKTFLLNSLLLAGCAQVPTSVPATSISYDGGAQDAGVLQLIAGGALVTPGFVARYDSLIGEYGKSFLPRLRADDGITKRSPSTFFIDNEHLADMSTMSALARQAKVVK